MGPIWGWQDPGGPMLAPWTLLSGICLLYSIWGYYQDTNEPEEDFISARDSRLKISYCVMSHFSRDTSNVLQSLAQRPVIYTIFKFLRWYQSVCKHMSHGCRCPSEGWMSLLRIPSQLFTLLAYHSSHCITITVYFMLNGINPLPLIYWNSVVFLYFDVCLAINILDFRNGKCNKPWDTCVFSIMMVAHLQYSSIIRPRGIIMRNHSCVRQPRRLAKKIIGTLIDNVHNTSLISSTTLTFTSVVWIWGRKGHGYGVFSTFS